MSQEQDASPTNVTSSSSTTAGATFSSGTEPTSDIPTTANSTTNNNNNNNRTKMADKDDEKSITFQPPRATTAAPLAFTSSGMVDSPVAVAKQNEPSSNDLLLGRNNDNIHTRARPRKDHETSETVRRKNTDPSQEPQRLPQLHHQSIGKVGSSSHGGIMKHTDEETSIFVAHSSQRPFAPSIRSQAKSETVGGRESMKSYRSTGGNRHLVKKNSAVSASVFSNLRSTMHERDRVLQEQKEAHKCCPVIFPWDPRYKGWWGFTVFGAIFTIFVETYGIAFSTAGLPEPADTSAILEYILYSIFLVDMLVNFDLAIYAEDGQVITQRMDIATNYFRFFFWVDFVGVFPFYPIALAVAGELGQDSRRAQYLSLLRLTRMVRLHRVKQLFDVLQLTSKISYLWLTLTRNLAAAVIWTHLAACTMYFISRQYDFDEDETMIGGNYPVLSPAERYIASMYWAVTTFATVGYGDYAPKNPAEEIFCCLYMYLNMVVQAWIIGSITLLIVKQDEKTGIYRDALKKLSRYAELHDFDRGFHQRLKTAVKLNFESKDVTDQEILYHFPSAVRRKILRRLYVPSLLQTSLLRGVRQQFVDAFLTACSVEVFSPGEEILQLGSVSTDLYLLVSGMVQLIEVDNSLVRFKRIQDSGTSVADSDEQGDSTRDMSIGEFLNEISFFTECPQTDSVTTVGVCKTLMISRFAYKQLCSDYPGSCTMILQNLHGKLNEQVYEMNDNDSGRDEVPLGADGRSMTHSSEVRRVVQSAQARASLTSIQDMVRIRIDAQKDEHTTKFLFAASRGDVTTISRMCDHGLDPNSTDYDSRTALMVAAMKGNTDIVKKLLEDYTCNPNLVDIHGSSALYEATKNGCDETVQVLLRNGAKLCMSDGQAASKLCQTVFDGDTLTLRRLLRSKILVNAADYDKRTAAHIAAAEGNLTALRMLVEFGADLSLRDRWNNSVEDEARKINSQKILLYLQFLEDKIEKPVTQNRSNDSVV